MTVSKKHNSNCELIGQGLANIIVPFFGGIPATGAMAAALRTAPLVLHSMSALEEKPDFQESSTALFWQSLF